MRPDQRSTTAIALIRLRTIAATLVLTLFANAVGFAAPPDTAQIMYALNQRGIGKGIKIKRTDGTTVSGVLTAVRSDSFDIAPANATEQVTIAYSQVSAVHNQGLSGNAKAGIFVGCVFVVVGVVLLGLLGGGSL